MKNKILAFIILSVLLLTSCVSDLEPVHESDSSESIVSDYANEKDHSSTSNIDEYLSSNDGVIFDETSIDDEASVDDEPSVDDETSVGDESSIDDETSVDDENSQNNNEVSGNETPNNSIFLYIPAYDGNNEYYEASGFVSSTLHGVNVDVETVVYNHLVNQTKSHDVLSEESFTYVYSELAYKTSDSTDPGSFYSIYDVYRNAQYKVKYLHDTDFLVFHSKKYNPDDSFPQMTESEVRSIAEAHLSKIVSKDILDNLEFRNMSIDALGRYALMYSRYIEGYDTDETISIWVDRSGEVSAFNGMNIGKYNHIQIPQKEQIEIAYSELVKKIEGLPFDNIRCVGTMITTDTMGRIYLEIFINFKTDMYDENGGEVLIRIS